MSVALPVWNGEPFLSEAIESILSQTLSDLELVVVDDGSTDRTPEILHDFALRDPRLKVHRQVNSGFVSAVNAAVQRCSANCIARMDADDIAVSDRLERQCQFLERHPQVGLVGGPVVIIDAVGADLSTWRIPQSDAQLRSALRTTNPFCDPAVMIRGSALRMAGGYRRAFGASADYDLWLRISERHELGALAKPVLRYRWHASQLSTRDMQSQLLGLVAARHASRLRRTTGADPFDGPDRMTTQLLLQTGLEEGCMRSELISEAAARAGALLSIGHAAEARALLDQAMSPVRPGAPASHQSRAQAALAYARACASETSRVDALKWLLLSAALDPTVVGAAAWRWLCRWSTRQ